MIRRNYKFFGLLAAVILLIAVVPLSTAHAQALFGIDSLSKIVEQLTAWFMTQCVALMSLLITIAGYLLNFSINLTLQIKSFVDSTPAIYTTWKTIRDIAGLCMIFFLLYAAFQLILDYERPKFDGLIKNIVIAGILINFSFFFAGLGIDVSNIVSVQIYNAIAPANSLNPNAANSALSGASWAATYDGGLSDIFMSSLKIQSFYKEKFTELGGNPVGNGANNAVAGTIASAPVKIFLMGAVAVLIEFCAAMSFAAAALAFIYRFVILLLLLAFSPVWMLGFLPEVGEYTKKWKDIYKAMLIFMPVYLLLMYVALSILTTSPMFGNTPSTVTVGAGNGTGNAPGQSFIERAFAANTGAQDGAWYNGFLVLGVNSAIVIVLLNMPLAAAASIAGGTIGLLNKAKGKYGYGAVFGKAAGMTSGYLGAGWKYSPGQQFAKFDKEVLGKKKWANTLLARDIRGATTQAVAGSKFGGDRTAADYKKEGKETAKKYVELDRDRHFEAALAGRPIMDPITKKPITLDVAMKRMTEKERTGMEIDKLTNPAILENLSKDDIKTIIKPDNVDMSDEDKARLVQAREELFSNTMKAAGGGDKAASERLGKLMKNMEIDDVVKGAGAAAFSTNEALIERLTPNNLKDIQEKGLLDDKQRRELGEKIFNWSHPGGATTATRAAHKAFSYVDKNDREWL